jgi:PAS domain-containing protein
MATPHVQFQYYDETCGATLEADMEPTSTLSPSFRDKKFLIPLEAAPDVMVIVNNQGVIVLVNFQLEKLFRWLRAEMLAKPVEACAPGWLLTERSILFARIAMTSKG